MGKLHATKHPERTVQLIELWPFQEECVDALRGNLAHHRRQILCSPTGSGKTEVAIRITKLAQEKDKRVWFVADRQTLINQTSQRFSDNDVEHGVLMGTASRGLWQKVLICSAQSLESRNFGGATIRQIEEEDGVLYEEEQEGLPEPDLIIIDECHEIRKKIVKWVVDKDIPTIGLSATPLTKGLGEIYSAVVNIASTQQLVKEGYLAPLRVVAAKQEVDVDGLTLSSTGEWVKSELSSRVVEVAGEIVPEWVKQTKKYYGGPVRTIAFCPTVADSMELAAKFEKAGFDFRVIHYRQTADEKQEIIDRFKAGDHIGLISCVALTKGFDAPATRVMIDAYPLRRSLAMHIQKVGRVMRTSDGKEFGLVIDHAGNWMGFYDETHAFFEAGVSELDDSKAKAERQAADREAMTCSQCDTVWVKGESSCVSCGMERPKPSFGHGRMVERSAALGEIDVVDGRGRKLPFQGDWWPEICAVACAVPGITSDRARKMALAKYKSIFGRWPKDDFRWVNRPPDQAVRDYTWRQYQRFKVAQRKAG